MGRSLVWSNGFRVGHGVLDEDHRHLIDLLGQAEDLIRAEDPDPSRIRAAYGRLLHLLEAHFAMEESLMRELPPGFYSAAVDRHCHAHAAILQRVRELIDGIAGSGAKLAERHRAIIGQIKELIFDDVQLLGPLAREGWLIDASPAAPARARGRPPLPVAAYLAAIAVLVVAVLSLVVGYAIHGATANLETETRSAARILLSTTADEVRQVLSANREALERMGRRPLIRQAGLDHCDGLLADFRQVFPQFANVAVVDLDGTAVCSVVPQPGGKPVNLAKVEWFQRAVTEKAFVVGKPFIGPITGRWVSVLASPVFDEQGTLVRVLALPLDLVSYVPSSSNAPLVQGTVITILTAEGIVVWRSQGAEQWVGRSAADAPALRAFLDQGRDEVVAASLDGAERVHFFQRIPDNGWIVHVGMPTAAFDAVRQRLLLHGLLLGGGGVLVVAVILFAISRRLVEPIRALAEAARASRQGGGAVRLPAEGPREVVEVAEEFAALLATRERQTDELLRSNAELERFAYVAAHDLQEPVRTVVSYAQLLQLRLAEALDGDSRQFLAFIVDGAKRMGDLVRDLLAYSRIGEAHLLFSNIDMAAVVREATAELDGPIRDSGAEVKVDSASLPTVHGARAQVLELVRNLIANAIRFHRPGVPPRIHIAMSDEGGERVFSVADNGIGIDRQYWRQIFLAFKRLHGSNYPGTGIGLAACKRIVERHGGRIWVESQPGQGSTFFFTLEGPG